MHSPIQMPEFENWMADLQNAGALPSTPFNWAVGLSGGADSMALTHLLHTWHKKFQPSAQGIALTVDHGLRPESAKEALQVGHWMAQQNIPHTVLKWISLEKPQTGLQAAARDARYDLMAAWCAAHDIHHLFLAHHRDDQIETFMIRLLRASGLEGLGGMHAGRPLLTTHGTLMLHRPLLHVPPQRLRATLEANQWPWVEDPSNQNLRFERVRIRNMLNPFESHKKSIFQSITKLQKADEALAWCTLKALRDMGKKNDTPPAWTLDKQAFCCLPEALQHRILQQVLTDLLPRSYPIRTQRVQNLIHRIQKETPLRRCTLGGCLVQEKKGQLVFYVENRRSTPSTDRPLGL